MDGQTALDRDVFYGIMARLTPTTLPASEPPRLPRSLPFDALPWPPHVSLALFVHRVQRLTPGVYLLVRDPRHEASLRGSLRTEFLWQRPEGCPAGVNLWLLQEADCRRAARAISCHQDIAADGVFSLGMLAEFEPVLHGAGPWFYPRLFWETGLIGQVLYLEAEAAGIRGTGIGCFFDDAMHDVLGIRDRSWQSLYHFTVGGPVDDPRLQTIPPYCAPGDAVRCRGSDVQNSIFAVDSSTTWKAVCPRKLNSVRLTPALPGFAACPAPAFAPYSYPTEGLPMTMTIFLSHSTQDKEVVAAIADAVQGQGLQAWMDVRQLTAGDQLEPAIQTAIEQAAQFVVVLSPSALASDWVRKEIESARTVAAGRQDGYKLIPVLIGGVRPESVQSLLGADVLAIEIDDRRGAVEAALPRLLAAIQGLPPGDVVEPSAVTAAPVADLVLRLDQPAIELSEGKRRATATVRLEYQPADGPPLASEPFRFTAPLGPIEAGELTWYLERYWRWPGGVFAERAKLVEAELPRWGQLLYRAIRQPSARTVIDAWRRSGHHTQPRFTVLIDRESLQGGVGDPIAIRPIPQPPPRPPPTNPPRCC